jgi:hypothetical protein
MGGDRTGTLRLVPYALRRYNALAKWCGQPAFKSPAIATAYAIGADPCRPHPGRCGGVVCLVWGFSGEMPWWMAGQQVG